MALGYAQYGLNKDRFEYGKSKDKVVEEKCPVPGKEHLPADSEDCEEDEAPTPTELPETGMGENILSLLGVGSLAGVTSAYIASRRK